MSRKVTITVVLLILLAGALVGIKALQINAMIDAGAAASIPAETISTTEVRQETWDASLPAVGSLSPVQGVTVRAELPGTVTKIAFESGMVAAAGQLLVQLDTSSEQAQLRSAEAQAELARLNLERARQLREQDLIAQSDLDSAEAAALQTVGGVDTIRATIAKKTIRAPFSGRLGIRDVNLGQFVGAGDPIVSLQSLDPIYVDFTLPEQQLGRIEPGMRVRITTDAAPGRTFEGRLTAQNPDIDSGTRRIRLQATLPNSDGALRAGMFARVQVVRPETQSVLVVPATAVLNAPYGDSVFVLTESKDEKTGRAGMQVRMTTVRLGEARGDFVAVTDGLKAGDVIAASGVFKLRNGSPVTVDNSLAPAPKADPTPSNS